MDSENEVYIFISRRRILSSLKATQLANCVTLHFTINLEITVRQEVFESEKATMLIFFLHLNIRIQVFFVAAIL